MADFSWKIARNAVTVHVKVSDNPLERLCKRCRSAEETVDHLLWECPVSQRFWRACGLLISDAAQVRLEVSKFDAVLGPSLISGVISNQRMFILLQTMRWILWKHRCHVVHFVAGDFLLPLSHFFIFEIQRTSEINVYLGLDSAFWSRVIVICPRFSDSLP